MSAITNKTKRSMDRYVEKENQKQKRLGVSENTFTFRMKRK